MMEPDIPPPAETWEQRLTLVVEMMREVSRQTNPEEMVRYYGQHVRALHPLDCRISLSRRGLEWPYYRITRCTAWKEKLNPWTQKDRLPLLAGGLLAELIYGDEPRLIDPLEVPPEDPAYEYLQGYRSLLAIPQYDQGVALNMVVALRCQTGVFSHERFPDVVWISNLFSRATNNLVLSDELRRAYQALDREFEIVGDIQRSLLPEKLPDIPSMQLAAHYQPSQRAGGDYYDFFALPDGKWGIFIADVSGHGPPAAVLMAITHCMAHTFPGTPAPPGTLLDYLNERLTQHYTGNHEGFVTAFYAIYEPQHRRLTYASAGHNPPRLKHARDGGLTALDGTGGLPLGVYVLDGYENAVEHLEPGDQLLFYTDGIPEAHNPHGDLFGSERLDDVLRRAPCESSALLTMLLSAVDEFCEGRPADDDRTLIVATVS